jgi:predicted nucleic acid-binding protein
LVIVVDASVAVKWYVNEPFANEAITFYAENQGNLIVPDVFAVEVVAALIRRANIEKTFRPDTERSVGNLVQLLEAGLVNARRSSSEQVARAATLALDLGHPLKDCIYLALAMELDCDLVTCDAKFAAKAKRVWDRVQVLGSEG